MNTGQTRFSIETKLILDTSQYPEEDDSLEDNLPTINSKTFDVPQQSVSCHKVDEDWHEGRSEDDKIVVHLLATDEGEKNKLLDLIHSTSFLSNMNSEISKIKELADGEVTLKSCEPAVKILTGISLNTVTMNNISC